MASSENAGHVRSHIFDVSIGFGERLQKVVLCPAIVLDQIRQFLVLFHLRGEQTALISLPLKKHEFGDIVALKFVTKIFEQSVALVLHGFHLFLG